MSCYRRLSTKTLVCPKNEWCTDNELPTLLYTTNEQLVSEPMGGGGLLLLRDFRLRYTAVCIVPSWNDVGTIVTSLKTSFFYTIAKYSHLEYRFCTANLNWIRLCMNDKWLGENLTRELQKCVPEEQMLMSEVYVITEAHCFDSRWRHLNTTGYTWVRKIIKYT